MFRSQAIGLLSAFALCWSGLSVAQEQAAVVHGINSPSFIGYEFPGHGTSKRLASGDIEVGTRILSRRDGWVKVSTVDGGVYWVEQKIVQIDIKPPAKLYRFTPGSNSAANRTFGGSN